jgi:hypothetical protein
MTNPEAQSAFVIKREIKGLLPVSGLTVPVSDLLAFAQAAATNGADTITVNRDGTGRIVGVAWSVEVPAE